MTQHALITLLLTVLIGICLRLSGTSLLLLLAACIAFVGLRNDV